MQVVWECKVDGPDSTAKAAQVWRKYTQIICRQLERAQVAGATSHAFKLGNSDYRLDFSAMKQINETTKYERAVRRRYVLQSIWQVELDKGWTSMSKDSQDALHKATAAGETQVTVTQKDPNVAGLTHTYVINLDTLSQVNVQSKTERKIRELWP